jgi:hypothetical protein
MTIICTYYTFWGIVNYDLNLLIYLTPVPSNFSMCNKVLNRSTNSNELNVYDFAKCGTTWEYLGVNGHPV